MISDSFRRRADAAAFWEAWAGAVLARAGLYTVHHPFTADGSSSHGLSWDLDVGPAPDRTIPVEIKALSLKFTGPEDYPFEEVLVCSENSWIRKWGYATDTKRNFLLVSMETGALVWIPQGTTTGTKTTTDRKRGETYAVRIIERSDLYHLHNFTEVVGCQRLEP